MIEFRVSPHRFAATCSYPPRCHICGRDPMDDVHVASIRLGALERACGRCGKDLEAGRSMQSRFCWREECVAERAKERNRRAVELFIGRLRARGENGRLRKMKLRAG